MDAQEQRGVGGRVSRRGFVAGAAALGLAAMGPSAGEGVGAATVAQSDAASGGATPGATRGVGLVLSHEQFPAPTLIELGIAAEAAGFDSIWTSDHFQPWMANQGHAGHAWVTLANLGARTRSIPFGTGVTCPIYRNDPATVAQAFATLAQFSPGRVFLGVGSGSARARR